MRKIKHENKNKAKCSIHISIVHDVTLYKEAKDRILSVTKTFNITLIFEGGHLLSNECKNLQS